MMKIYHSIILMPLLPMSIGGALFKDIMSHAQEMFMSIHTIINSVHLQCVYVCVCVCACACVSVCVLYYTCTVLLMSFRLGPSFSISFRSRSNVSSSSFMEMPAVELICDDVMAISYICKHTKM